MVGHTHGSPEGFSRETGSGSQQPLPPPPNLAKLMAMQTELLRQLVQGQQNPPHQQKCGGRDEQPAGYRTVLQYAQAFNHLYQYAGHHADTDAKKRDRFRRGLNTKLKERLNLVQPDTYNELVNMAITQEDCIAAHRAEKKRKAPTGPSSAQPPRYRLVQNTPPRAPQRNAPTGRFVFRPPQQQGRFRPPVFQQPQ